MVVAVDLIANDLGDEGLGERGPFLVKRERGPVLVKRERAPVLAKHADTRFAIECRDTFCRITDDQRFKIEVIRSWILKTLHARSL